LFSGLSPLPLLSHAACRPGARVTNSAGRCVAPRRLRLPRARGGAARAQAWEYLQRVEQRNEALMRVLLLVAWREATRRRA